jgi:hypothetical protein
MLRLYKSQEKVAEIGTRMNLKELTIKAAKRIYA